MDRDTKYREVSLFRFFADKHFCKSHSDVYRCGFCFFIKKTALQFCKWLFLWTNVYNYSS